MNSHPCLIQMGMSEAEPLTAGCLEWLVDEIHHGIEQLSLLYWIEAVKCTPLENGCLKNSACKLTGARALDHEGCYMQ